MKTDVFDIPLLVDGQERLLRAVATRQQQPRCRGNRHNKFRPADLQAHNSAMVSVLPSQRLFGAAGLAAEDTFKNIVVFLEDWQLKLGHAQNISEMSQNAACSAQNQDNPWLPWLILQMHAICAVS